MDIKNLLHARCDNLIPLIFILFLFVCFNIYASESTMEFNGTSTSFNGITVTFSTGAFTGSSDGSSLSLYSNHPYGTPINGGNDYKDISISPATYIVRVTVAWGVNVQGFKLQFLYSNSLVKELNNFNAGGNITSPTNFTVDVLADKIRFRDAGVSSSGGFELSHVTFDSSLPVELASFTAIVSKGNVELSWQTATEVNNYGFNVERRAENEEWTKIGFVKGNGNSNSPKGYTFIDDLNLNLNHNLSYRLKQIDNDGTFEYSDIVDVAVNLQPLTFELHQNYPNPFNPSTVISYQLPINSSVNLKVYNLLGQEVATLVNEQKKPGNYEVSFNGSNLASGVYIYRLEAGTFTALKKLMLVK